MELIYDHVKAGEYDNLGALNDVMDRLSDAGAEVFILGCTELSVAGKVLGILDNPEIVTLCAVWRMRLLHVLGMS